MFSLTADGEVFFLSILIRNSLIILTAEEAYFSVNFSVKSIVDLNMQVALHAIQNFKIFLCGAYANLKGKYSLQPCCSIDSMLDFALGHIFDRSSDN